MNQAESPHVKKMRVLIADDIQETRRNTRLMLSMIPDVEVVAIASDGLQAVQMAREQHPDIVVLDINMPELNGLEAFKQIRKVYPNTGCIIISAETEMDIIHEAMSLGIREYLFKPFTVDQMEQAIEKVSLALAKKREQKAQTDELIERNKAYLTQLATEYTKLRRVDDQAVKVYEHLAADPDCELRWMRTLAMVYVIRQDWGKLESLAARLSLKKNNTRG